MVSIILPIGFKVDFNFLKNSLDTILTLAQESNKISVFTSSTHSFTLTILFLLIAVIILVIVFVASWGSNHNF